MKEGPQFLENEPRKFEELENIFIYDITNQLNNVNIQPQWGKKSNFLNSSINKAFKIQLKFFRS